MPAQAKRLALEGHMPTRRNQDLMLHQVQPRHHFRYRMLHLNARVHFQKVEIPLLIHQQLNRARARVTDFLERLR